MNKLQKRQHHNAERRKGRIRAKIAGTATVPRLHVFRSNRGVYVQLIDDERGVTLASVAAKEVSAAGSKTAMSEAAGKAIAEKAKQLSIGKAVFDRGGRQYHGRVKAIADGARAAGLEI